MRLNTSFFEFIRRQFGVINCRLLKTFIKITMLYTEDDQIEKVL